MGFAVFGVNKVKCKDDAFKYISAAEGKAGAVLTTEAARGGELGKHFENVISGTVDPDQYERALSERFNALCSSAKWTCISPKYDTPAAAIEYMQRLTADGGKGCIKQHVGVTDGMGEAVFTKLGKKQKLEWLLFDTESMKVVRK